MKSSYDKGKLILIATIQTIIIMSGLAILFVVSTHTKISWHSVAQVAKIDGLILSAVFIATYLYHIYTAIFKKIK